MQFSTKVNLDTLSIIVTTNFILVMILTLIFSSWRVYATSTWLIEVKNHIDKDIKTVIRNQESVKKDIVINQKAILINQQAVLANQEEFKRISAILLENTKAILEIKKEINRK